MCRIGAAMAEPRGEPHGLSVAEVCDVDRPAERRHSAERRLRGGAGIGPPRSHPCSRSHAAEAGGTRQMIVDRQARATLGAISDLLDAESAAWALMGGVAANVYRHDVRATGDVDFLVSFGGRDAASALAALAASLARSGWVLGDDRNRDWMLRARNPESGVVDIISTGMAYQEQAVERAVVHVQDDGTQVRVLAVEDVIVHKLIAGIAARTRRMWNRSSRPSRRWTRSTCGIGWPSGTSRTTTTEQKAAVRQRQEALCQPRPAGSRRRVAANSPPQMIVRSGHSCGSSRGHAERLHAARTRDAQASAALCPQARCAGRVPAEPPHPRRRPPPIHHRTCRPRAPSRRQPSRTTGPSLSQSIGTP